MARALSALTLVTAIGTGLSGLDLVQLDAKSVTPGQALVVELTGELLKDYLRCCQEPNDLAGMSFCVFVHQVLDDGRFIIEHSKLVETNGRPDRLVTFAMTVKPNALEPYHPPGVRLGALKANLELDETQPGAPVPPTAVLRLSDAKAIQIRQWTLVK
jgi:hypothetical protein